MLAKGTPIRVAMLVAMQLDRDRKSGFAYVAVTWQIAAEAIVPLNRVGGNSPGLRTQLLFFLDDLIPSVFGKPLLTNKPARSQIAW
jgi:hypothetical protein